ncbi:MAG TPA: ATP-binding protein, partial [Euryarchaeota archaeon]|nr:ATP-binding protein [Euryarchaeota archaeon]
MSVTRVELSNEEKILLHLLDHTHYEEKMHVPHHLTQKGISDKTGIRINHIPKTIRRLVENGELEEFLAYVHGAKRKRKAYSLTEMGKVRGKEVLSDIQGREITVVDGLGRSKETTIESVYKKVQESMSLVDLIELVDNDNRLDENLCLKGEGVQTVSRLHNAPLAKDFLGRDKELQELSQWLKGSEYPLLMLSGIRGVGKSWLVSHFMKRLVDWNKLYLDLWDIQNDRDLRSFLGDFASDLHPSLDVN